MAFGPTIFEFALLRDSILTSNFGLGISVYSTGVCCHLQQCFMLNTNSMYAAAYGGTPLQKIDPSRSAAEGGNTFCINI